MNNLYDSILFNTDSYKFSHWLQLPPKTQKLFSYIEARGGDFEECLFFGLQSFIRNYMMRPITIEEIDFVEPIIKAHGEPFNRQGFERIVTQHGGFFPVRIRAVPEGTVVPIRNVMVTIENLDDQMPWITNFLETAILRSVWYGSTVATTSFRIKRLIKRYLEKTGDVNLLPFKLHDFGARGVSSRESARLGGAAHLVNFMGTDTVDGFIELMKNYDADGVPAFSIPAAEHSTITIWGQENEAQAYQNMLTQFAKPGSLLAVVSDSYNIFEACEMWGTTLKQQVIDSGATVVIRPDSGEPHIVVKSVLDILAKNFGYTLNEKGYKVLNNVRVIQGDGINYGSIEKILDTATDWDDGRYSADNIAFGMGGALLQQINRDTMEFAMKCSYAVVDGQPRDVFKNPVTSSAKASKRGRLTLLNRGSEFKTVAYGAEPCDDFKGPWTDALQTVYSSQNGVVQTQMQNIKQIRDLANKFV